MARNTLDFYSNFQTYSPTSIIMPSSSSSPFSLSLHRHHHYPLITSTTSTSHHSFIPTYLQLHIPKPKPGKAEAEEEEDEEEEGEGRERVFFTKGSNNFSGESSVSVRSIFNLLDQANLCKGGFVFLRKPSTIAHSKKIITCHSAS
uniref:Uncharacterized protein n=1 Tax=Salix viminalis TaxID=40686 RepID=A0A6N2LH01_SALVM